MNSYSLIKSEQLKNILLSCLLLFSIITSAQKNNLRTKIIDSLLQEVKKSKADTNQIRLYNKLSENYRQSDKDKAMYYALQALDASNKLDWQKGYFGALNNQALTLYYYGERKKALDIFLPGLEEASKTNNINAQSFFSSGAANCYYKMGDKENALKYHAISQKCSEQLKDKKSIATGLMNMGLVYGEIGDYKKELDCYQRALLIQEELKDYSNAGNTLENLGIFFIYRGDSLNAFKNLKKALEIRIKLGDKNAQATTMNNIAGAYSMFGNNETCLVFLMKALEVHEQLGDIAGIASVTNNICDVYAQMQNYTKAIEFSNRSKEAHIKSNDSSGVAINYKNLAVIYSQMGKLNEAENTARISFDLCKKYGSKDMIIESYTLLAEILFKKGDTRNAYLLHKQYSDMKDSIMTETNSKQINEMNAKYESEKKDKDLLLKDNEIKIQEADAKQKSYQRNGFIAGFLVLFILVFYIFRIYKLKRDAHSVISKQKEKVERAKEMIEEKQKEILDSIYYAKRIQQSLLPTTKYIDKTIKRLHKK